MNGWVAILRIVLELLYYVSGIAIAIAAFLGLRQLKIGLDQITISKEVARTNARRESIRYASDQCRYFAEQVVPLMTDCANEYRRQNLTFLTIPTPSSQQPFFQNITGEISTHGYDLKVLDDQWPKVGPQAVAYLNALESFAIPFAAGVADEEIGYRETARPFCQSARDLLPCIFQLRRTNAGRYESVVQLYSMWSNRWAADIVGPLVGNLGDFLKTAGKGRITPIGPNF